MKSRIRKFPVIRIGLGSVLIGLLACVLSPSSMAASQPEDAPTLHVLRPIINAEKAKAEICLEFDHPVVAQSGAARAQASLSLKLESEDRKQTLSARAATYSGNELCVPGLTHRTSYRLKLSAFRSPSNGKLGSPYSLSFTVPARRPMLAFAGDSGGATVSRWRENPILRSMNVGEAKIELFRVKDPARMAEAWSLREQTALAPSETATFAHTYGELVWQGEQSFDGKPDEGNEKQISLPANAEAGLYLVVASAPNLITKKTELVPISALWLLRSDLKVKILQTESGFYAIASDDKAARIPERITVTAYNKDYRKIAEAPADAASGIAYVAKPAAYATGRKREPFSGVVIATDGRGHAGFADLNETTSRNAPYTLPPSETSMLVARGAYAPEATADVMLASQDLQGKALKIDNSSLQILRKDGSVYASYQVREAANGKAHMAFPAPATEGIWNLAWKRSDGGELATGKLKVASVSPPTQIEVAADRDKLSSDGELVLSIRSETLLRAPSPMIQGKIRIEWKRIENIFDGWNGFVFGASPNNERQEGKFLASAGAARKTAPFITDEQGYARVSARIAPPQKNEGNDAASSLWVAMIFVESERGSGAFDPPALEIPLKPAHMSVGIKALSAQSRFPENSLARFDIVALDGEGNRMDADNLIYRVYEEGRRFEWYPNAGKWDYKPVPQRTRMEGGPLPMSAESRGLARLEIPVTSGAYRLEIADTEGRIMAQIPFSAGWGMADAEPSNVAPMPVKLVPSVLKPGSEAKIQLKLDRPALVRIVIADDRIRKVLQEAKPKGNAEITFVPLPEWGKKLKITADAETPGSPNVVYRGQLETAPATTTQLFTKKELEDASSATLAIQSLKSGLQSWQMPESQRASNQLRNAPSRDGLSLNSTDRISLPPQKEWSPPEQAPDGRRASAQNEKPSSSAAASRTRRGAKEERARGKTDAVAFVAPVPIMNLPTILSSIVYRPAYTLAELGGSLQTLLRWKETLIESGLISQTALAERVKNETTRILNRQSEDGGFSAMPGGEPDMASTASALSVLSALENAPALAPAIGHAREWLSSRLENAWYAERERPERALAYGALARAGKSDVSNLRYFADTSADKELPPLACANIALAFAYNDDKNQALFWIDKTRNAIMREKEVDAAVKAPESARGAEQEGEELVSPSTLANTDTRADIVAAWRALAENRFMNSETAAQEINKVAEALFSSASRRRGLDVMSDLAWGLKASLEHIGEWRISLHGVDSRISKGVAIVPIPSGATATTSSRAPATIRNASGKTLSVEVAQWGKRSALRANMTRKILTLDGAPTRGELRMNETYVVIDEGQWPENEADELLVADAPGPMLAPQTCAIHPAASYGFLGWLKDWNLALEQHCERASDGIFARLSMRQKESPDQAARTPPSAWRIAWLARPRARGSQILPPPRLRALFPGAKTYEGPSDAINVR